MFYIFKAIYLQLGVIFYNIYYCICILQKVMKVKLYLCEVYALS